MAGGMMRFGIPKYRLPRDVLDAEMQRIEAMGVTLELGAKVERIDDTMKAGGSKRQPCLMASSPRKRSTELMPTAESILARLHTLSQL